jgi:uncharacterized protein (TIGR02646 family)
MIRVTKPAPGPPILSRSAGRGPKETERLCEAYDAGIRDFDFDPGIYASRSVKNALIGTQYGKCAFCESKFTHIAFGDVEHFRPKGGWVQAEGDVLNKPGYYWLAYAWDNLYASCQICNQKFKRNLFPLANRVKRLRSHRDEPSREQPLLIDPGPDDPGAFIGFREEYPFAIGGNPRGTATIAMLGLDREELAEVRRDALRPFTLIVEAARILEMREQTGGLTKEERALLQAQRVWLTARKKPSAEYSAMLNAVVAAKEAPGLRKY